ncbi:MAG TPA: hypothetical protein PK025_10490, partial [Spirochaetales bacterium]|nr:hypothetical protein [Spirochaetales bacterium]
NGANEAQKPANNNTQSIKQATQSSDRAKERAQQGLSNNPQQWGYSTQGRSNGSSSSDAGAGKPSSSSQSVPANKSRKGAERAEQQQQSITGQPQQGLSNNPQQWGYSTQGRANGSSSSDAGAGKPSSSSQSVPANKSRKGAERAEQQQQSTNTKPQKSHADMVRMNSNYSSSTPHEAGMNSAGRSYKKQNLLIFRQVQNDYISNDSTTKPLLPQPQEMKWKIGVKLGNDGFSLQLPEEKKEITTNDFVYSNQHDDIAAPGDLYCVYTTAWNSYKNAYYVDTGIQLNRDQAIFARENAFKDEAINFYGRVLNYYKLADSFNKTFGTNYKYDYTEEYVQKIPDNLYPYIKNNNGNTVEVGMPHVRYTNYGQKSKYAHTVNYLGDQKAFDVYTGKVIDISNKTKVVSGVDGYDERYGKNGSYRVGYHIWEIPQ